jgi:hypothetical protein
MKQAREVIEILDDEEDQVLGPACAPPAPTTPLPPVPSSLAMPLSASAYAPSARPASFKDEKHTAPASVIAPGPGPGHASSAAAAASDSAAGSAAEKSSIDISDSGSESDSDPSVCRSTQDLEGNTLWEVHSILNDRRRNGVVEYLVKCAPIALCWF